jgi:hypothetical protein
LPDGGSTALLQAKIAVARDKAKDRRRNACYVLSIGAV